MLRNSGRLFLLTVLLLLVAVNCKDQEDGAEVPDRHTDETQPRDALIDLSDLYAEYASKQKEAAVINQAFAGQWEDLTANTVPRPLAPGIEFLQMQTKATGDREYSFYFLLRTTAEIGTDFHLVLLGAPLHSNEKYLPRVFQKNGAAQWNLNLIQEPTSCWRKGEYRVLRLKAETSLVPYSLRLLLVTRNPALQWVDTAGEIVLGWQWATRSETDMISQIKSCTSFWDLFALAPPGPSMSKPLSHAVGEKWRDLTSHMPPRSMVDGVEFLTLKTDATGEREYTFSFLLRATKTPTLDYDLKILGVKDAGTQEQPRPTNSDSTYAAWSLRLSRSDPSSLWKPGEYHVAQLTVDTELIPYDVRFWLVTRDEKGALTGNCGNKIYVGWQAAIWQDPGQQSN